MKQYEELNLLYEDVNTHYENVMRDCFGGLHKLFAASYPNTDNSDLKEVFAVIAWELCKVKAEIEKLKYLRDPDRVPAQFIKPLAAMFGITEFPNMPYPEDQRRYMSFAYELQKYKGTRYGLELLLKSLMPFDEVKLLPMYRRGLRTFYPNNDYTGGRMAGSTLPSHIAELSAGLPVDWRTAGSTSYPTGIYICVTRSGARNDKVIKGALNRIEPILKEFMPESGFYKIVVVGSLVDPYAITFGSNEMTIGGELVTIGNPNFEIGIPEGTEFVTFVDGSGNEGTLTYNDAYVYVDEIQE